MHAQTEDESPDSSSSPSPEAFEYLDDLEQIQEGLELDRARLFDTDALRVEVWPRSRDDCRHLREITDREELEEFLHSWPTNRNTFIILRLEYTLGPLRISLDMFKLLITTGRIFPPFLNCVRAFGPDGSGEQYSGFDQRKSEKYFEICYNIHYPALHGRDSVPPWSIRHTAAYQKYELETKKSQWVFIEPSQVTRNRLERFIQKDSNFDESPALPHLAVFQSAEAEWEEYLKYWGKEYKKLENRTRYSKVGTITTDQFEIKFKDNQRLEHIRQRLATSAAILASCIDTAVGCTAFCENLDSYTEIREATKSAFEMHIRRMHLHARSADLLLKQSNETGRLLSEILQFRNDEASIKSSQMMTNMMRVLTELGESGKQENVALMTLTKQARQDSRFTKILTFVALLYLPASLVATVFSSNLLQTVQVGENLEHTQFVLTTQFWVFPVLSTGLLLVTILPAMLFEKFQKKRDKLK